MKALNITALKSNSIKMHDDLGKSNAEMRSFIAVGESKSKLVRVKMNGFHHVEKVDISDKWSGDKAELGKSLAYAFNDALEQVDNEIELRMSSIIMRYTKETLGE